MPVPNIQWINPYDEQGRCPKHVKLCTRINLGISASVGFIKKKLITMLGHKKVKSSLSINSCTVHRLRAESAFNRCTVQLFIDSNDTRCCVNTIFPPEDGHVNARNMSRIVN